MSKSGDHVMLTRSKTTQIIKSITDAEEDRKKKTLDNKINSLFLDEGSPKKSKKSKKKYSPIVKNEIDLNIMKMFNTSNIYNTSKNMFNDKTINFEFIYDKKEEEEEEDEEDDEESVEYDKYDEEFIELNDEDMFEDKKVVYFQNLAEADKKKYLKSIKEINSINEKNIPLQFKVLKSDMPAEVKAYAMTIIDKIESEQDTTSSDTYKLEKWVEGAISIPFSKYISMKAPENDNNKFIMNVHKCLNGAIYGHREAKCHILQLVAKWLKNPDSPGNVLAIQGPMGNGKTTLVKDGIAKALGRPFAFISLGGASDSSYLNGHSFTYEGSIWGRIVDILIKSKCMNPVIYFDELDKVSDTSKGDEIINMLTHMTDFSQNDRFQDNYFSGIDLDLSKVLFIFSFNDESKVNRILKDRMNVINTKGFNLKEKIKISNNYLLPKLYNSFKFEKTDIIFNDNIIEYIVNNYTSKEQGVRNLQRCLETILSKINMYNIYKIENKDEEEDEALQLPYEIKDFKIPYTMTIDTLQRLLKIKTDDAPPPHMYL